MTMQVPTLQQTSWKFSPSLLQDTTGEESTIVTRKIRIYPTKNQLSLFKKCVGTHRYFYNKAVAEINTRYKERMHEFINHPTCLHCDAPKENGSFNCKQHKKRAIPWKLDIKLQSIREAVLKSDSNLSTDEQWQKEIPYDTRQLAIKDAVSAYKSATALKVKGIVQQFQLKFKKKTMPKQSFWIDHRAIKEGWKIFPQRLKVDSGLVINKRHQKFLKNKKIENDVQIMNDRGCWYLLLTYQREQEKWDSPEFEAISLDPGVRTFQTGYCPQGLVMKMGEEQITNLKKLHTKIDKLKSIRSNKVCKKRKKKHIKDKLKNHQKNVFDVVDDLHNQVASMLTNKFQHIILPPFETSKMLQEDCIQSNTKRMMGALSFYRFKNKLIAQSQRKKRDLHIESEACTTKTCGLCGSQKKVGGTHVYKCPCGYEMDRDVHGARNIFIRYQTIMG